MDWQEVIVLCIVAGAALAIIWRTWRWVNRGDSDGCGSCSRCPSSSESVPAQLVSLDMDLADSTANSR